MDELLQTLLDAELLTPQTRQQVTEAFQSHINTVLSEKQKELEVEIRAQLTERWVEERENIIEALDAKCGEFLTAEISQLKEDIDRFRDLEAEYAGKIVEARAEMAEELKEDMATLINQVDSFLEERLNIEFEELREDIEEAKKDRFGRRIFEAFTNEYSVKFVDEDSLQAKLHESTNQVQQLQAQLNETTQQTQKLLRENEISRLLTPLSGTQRDIMETLLKTSPDHMLESTYNTYIGRVIVENVTSSSEKEDKVLAEGSVQLGKNVISEQAVVREGNSTNLVTEALVLKESESIIRLRKLSGQME
jgi:hypothetical protein